MRAWWLTMGLLAVGCAQEEGIGGVEQGVIEITRYRQGIDLVLRSEDDACLSPSKQVTATVDGIELELQYRGNWSYDPLNDVEYCMHTTFASRVPLTGDVPVSTVVVEDGRDRLEFEVPHLRVPHEVSWVEPADGVLENDIPATFELTPADERVGMTDYEPFARLSFWYDDYADQKPHSTDPSRVVCTEGGSGPCDNFTLEEDSPGRFSFLTPSFCGSGAWRWWLPVLEVDVPRVGGFEVEVFITPATEEVQVVVGDDAPPCEG